MYSLALSEKDLQNYLEVYDSKLEFLMPDRYMVSFIPVIEKIILEINNNSSEANIDLIRTLICLSSNKDCRAKIMSFDIYDSIFRLQNDENLLLRLCIQKLINNLLWPKKYLQKQIYWIKIQFIYL